MIKVLMRGSSGPFVTQWQMFLRGIGQPVAQFRVRIGCIWVIFSAHGGNIGGSPGFPRVFACDTTAAS